MNRFDIVEGYYCYFVLWHGGQGSREYQRLSKMQTYYSPGAMGNDDPERLSEGAREVYDSLVERNQHAKS